MKIRFQFKSPDVVFNAIHEAVRKELDVSGMTARVANEAIDERVEEIEEQLRTWILFGEYVTVEFDTVTGTMEVVKVK